MTNDKRDISKPANSNENMLPRKDATIVEYHDGEIFRALDQDDPRRKFERNPAIVYTRSITSVSSQTQAIYKLVKFARCWNQMDPIHGGYLNLSSDYSQQNILEITPWHKLTSKIVYDVITEICFGNRKFTGLDDRTKRDERGNRKASNSTYNQYLSLLKNIANTGTRTQVISPIEAKLINDWKLRHLQEKAHVDDYFKPDQVRTLVDYCLKENTNRGLRDAAMFTLYFITAARRSAIAELDVDAINHAEQTIHILTKGSNYQTLPLSPIANKLLVAYMDKGRITEGKIFRRISKADKIMQWSDCDPKNQGARGTPYLTGDGIYRILKKRLTEAGLPTALHPHAFRRGRLTQLRDLGEDIFTLQLLANHKRIETTQKYIRGTNQKVMNAVKKNEF